MSRTPSLDTSDFYHFIIINYHYMLIKITCCILLDIFLLIIPFLLTNKLLRFAFSSRRIWKESLRNYKMHKNLLICINVRHLNIFLMLFLYSFYFSDIFCSFTLMHSPRLPDLHSIAWTLRRSVSCVILRKYCAVQYDIHSSGFITPAHHFGLPVKNRSLIVTLNCELCTEKF